MLYERLYKYPGIHFFNLIRGYLTVLDYKQLLLILNIIIINEFTFGTCQAVFVND